jgi:hypothetical protein
MRIVSIREVLALGAGETIPSVKGRVLEVFDRNSGTISKGPRAGESWAIQNLRISDGTGEIKIMVKDREDALPKSYKGRELVLSCNDGNKGLTGLKAQDDEYRGKVERIIAVTKSAHIELADGAAAQNAPSIAAPAAAPNTQPPAPAPAQSQAAPQSPANTPPTNGDVPTNPVSAAAHRRSQDYYRVMCQVYTVRTAWDKAHPEHTMTDDHFQAACSTVFIQLQRDGIINGR